MTLAKRLRRGVLGIDRPAHGQYLPRLAGDALALKLALRTQLRLTSHKPLAIAVLCRGTRAAAAALAEEPREERLLLVLMHGTGRQRAAHAALQRRTAASSCSSQRLLPHHLAL